MNLMNPQESDITPNKNLVLPDSSTDRLQENTLQGRQEWWRLLALLALLVFITEWLVYNRAVLAKIRSQISLKRTAEH